MLVTKYYIIDSNKLVEIMNKTKAILKTIVKSNDVTEIIKQLSFNTSDIFSLWGLLKN